MRFKHNGVYPGARARTVRAVSNFVTVTDQILRSPKPEDWLIYRGNYEAWGYSPLDQINKTNVKTLQLVWSRVMAPGINQATPLVYNGVIFLGNPGDVIQAIDAATGDLLWEYRHPLPPTSEIVAVHGQRKRSIALYGDHVYTVTWDNIVLALDARTGERVWQTDRGGDLYISNSTGPIVANGVVVAGSTCQRAGFGCYVTGHDAQTGRELWRNEMIPRPGEPGDETWAGSPFEARWMTGVWGHIVYDPELDLVYYGSSGVGPALGSPAQHARGNHGRYQHALRRPPPHRRSRLEAPGPAARQLGPGVHLRDDGDQHAGQSRPPLPACSPRIPTPAEARAGRSPASPARPASPGASTPPPANSCGPSPPSSRTSSPRSAPRGSSP